MKTKKNDVISQENNITKKDFRKVFWRSFTLLGSYNFERMEALGFNYSILPALKKIYKDDREKLAAALKRHMETFNMTVAPSTFVMGIAIAMEEQNARDEDFDEGSINALKLALMGPLSGIGDTFFWGIFRILGAAIGVSFAQQGSILAPFVMLLIFNIPHFLVRYFGMFIGYKNGSEFIDRMERSGRMSLFTYCAGIVGITAVGCMIATQIAVATPLAFTISGNEIVIQEYLDQIMPKLLPMIASLIIYYCLKKDISVTKIMISIVVIGFILGSFGILA